MTELQTSRRARKKTCVPAVQTGLLIPFPEEGEIGDGHDGALLEEFTREAHPRDSKPAAIAPGRSPADSPVVADHPPAYRKVIAGWTDNWRERWGLRANSLEEVGFSWRDAETQAFLEVLKQIRENSRPADAIGDESRDFSNAGLN